MSKSDLPPTAIDSDARSDESKGRFQLAKVDNFYGSGAGSGSGDFHTYRQHRRTEMERMEEMENEQLAMIDKAEFKRKLDQNEQMASAKTSKNAAKRRREKARKQGKCIKSSNTDVGNITFVCSTNAPSTIKTSTTGKESQEIICSVSDVTKTVGNSPGRDTIKKEKKPK